MVAISECEDEQKLAEATQDGKRAKLRALGQFVTL